MKHPERLGKYPITGILGEGAMGVVYKAHDPVIQRPVAIKTIRKHLIDGSENGAMMAARFRNEAQAAGRLLHPGVVAVYEYGEDGDVAYIAMEYVEGNSLAHYLSREIRFSDADVLSLMTQLLDALDHAHGQGVWHRDIKPANLIITRAGKVKVADFGIARIESIGLTQVNSVVGTPSYMAPEQYLGRQLDRRVDIWACGVLLYQLVTGRLPFTGSADTVMYKVVHEQPPWPSQLSGIDRPAWYDGILATAMAKQPDQRYATAQQFRTALLAASAEPVRATVSEETIIMEVARPIELLPGAASGQRSGASTGGTSGSGTGTAPPPGWDASTLAEVESTLARYVGPVARVLVRRAARECVDLITLRTRLAEHLPTEQDKAMFIGLGSGTQARTHAGSGTGMAAAPTVAATGSTPPPSGGGVPLTPELVEHATRLLATRVGPIARVLAKKAAAQSTWRDEFFQRVAEQVADPEDRAQLMAEFARLG